MYRALELKTTDEKTIEVRADGLALYDGGGAPRYVGRLDLAEVVDVDPLTSPWQPTDWADVLVIAGAKEPILLVRAIDGTKPSLPKGYSHALRVGSVRFGADRKLWRTLQRGNEVAIIDGPDWTRFGPDAGTFHPMSPEMARFSLADFTPPTAMAVNVTAMSTFLGKRYGRVMLAPNTRLSGADNGPLGKFGRLPQIWINGGRPPGSSYDPFPELVSAWITLEGPELYDVMEGGAHFRVNGWRDNL